MIHGGPKNMDDFEKLGREKIMRERNGESSGSDKVSRLSALAGESFEAWWNRYVHGRLLNRDHREQARDGWLAREAQLRAAVAGALEWAAGWVENSATDATREFARNMAMTIRAQRGAWSAGSAPLSAERRQVSPIPEGYMIVPVEPDALVLSRIPGANARETYRAITSLANLRTASICVESWACAAELEGQRRCEQWCRDEANCVASFSRTDWRPQGATAKRPSDEWYRRKIAEGGDSEPEVSGGAHFAPSSASTNNALAPGERKPGEIAERGTTPDHSPNGSSGAREGQEQAQPAEGALHTSPSHERSSVTLQFSDGCIWLIAPDTMLNLTNTVGRDSQGSRRDIEHLTRLATASATRGRDG